MKWRTSLLIAAAAIALTRCAPATATASLDAPLADSIRCTAVVLGSMGYDVITADERNGMVKGQRLKHATNPFSGAMDADRITVFLGPQDSRTSLQIIGETVGSQVGVRFPSRTRRIGGWSGGPSDGGGLVRKWTSKEVAADTEMLARACAD